VSVDRWTGTGPGHVCEGCSPGEEGREVKQRGNQREQEGHKSERTQYTQGGEGRDGLVLTCGGVWHLQGTR
jgi:hypothetical protein